MNGSELALRVALSDVIEKWKRSQEKCKYFEQCRNELVKELQRVKQVNEDLIRENSALQASLETSASLPNRTDNGMADGGMRHAKSHSPLVPVSSADRMRHEEDVKQIYQRLLTEMQQDVIQAAARNPQKSAAASENASNRTHLIATDCDNSVVANNSVGSELVVANQSRVSSAGGTGIHKQQQQQDRVQWIKDQGDSKQGNKLTTADHKAASGKQVADMDENRLPAAGQPQQSQEIVQMTDGEKSLSHVYAKIIAALSADLMRATQTIMNQKEKLAKLKSKQLRSYFRRLKGEDQQQQQLLHQSGNISNSSASRCHFEQV